MMISVPAISASAARASGGPNQEEALTASRTSWRARSVPVAMAMTLLLTAVAPVSAAPPYEPCDVQNATVSHPGTAGQSPNNDLDCYAVAIERPDNTAPDYTPQHPWSVRPLLSVGDQLPRTRNSAQSYQMVGLPDGLGIRSLEKSDRSRYGRDGDNDDDERKGGALIYMNHEIGVAPFPGPQGNGPVILSQAVIGEAQNKGAFVSTWVVNKDGRVVSGDYAYDTVYYEDALVGPISRTDNTTVPFARFCSATLAGREQGFDRPIFLARVHQLSECPTTSGWAPPIPGG